MQMCYTGRSVNISVSTRGVLQTSSHCSTVCGFAETEVCSAEAIPTPGRIRRVLTTVGVRERLLWVTEYSVLPEESDIPEAPEACEESACAGGADGAVEEEEEGGGGWCG